MSQKPTFTVIHSPKRRDVNEHLFPSPIQDELFAAYSPNTLILVVLPKISDEEFLAALDLSRPSLIVDVRRFPRFDIGSLSRLKVFEQFANRGIRYLDCGAGSDPACLISRRDHLRGIVMVLFDDRPETPETATQFTEFVSKATHEAWAVIRLPSFFPGMVSSALKTG